MHWHSFLDREAAFVAFILERLNGFFESVVPHCERSGLELSCVLACDTLRLLFEARFRRSLANKR